MERNAAGLIGSRPPIISKRDTTLPKMPKLYPSVVLLIPLLASAVYGRDLLRFAFVTTIPFFGLIVFEAGGHWFTLPEVAVLLLAFDQLVRFTRSDSELVLEKKTVLIMVGFLFIGIYSTVLLILFPSDQMTHSYDAGTWMEFHTEPLRYSRYNFTQTILRVFSFACIFTIASAFTKNQIIKSIRILAYEGILIGGIGVLFQFSILLDYPLIEVGNWLGIYAMKYLPPFFGPLPHLMSVPGEQGYTAHYFLFLIGLTVPMAISGSGKLLSQRESYIFSVIFGIFIVFTGSGTGFGGLIILSLSAVFYYGIVEMSTESIKEVIANIVLAGFTTISIGVVIIDRPIQTAANVIKELAFRGGSGDIRANAILYAWDLFLTRPITGYGFGSYYGASIIGTFLATTGLIGLALFLTFHGSVFRDLVRKQLAEPIVSLEADISRAIAISLMTVLGTMLIAKSITATLFPWYWTIVGFAIAIVIDN